MSTDHRTRTLCLAAALHAFTHVYQVALLPLYLPIQRDFKLENVGQATLLVTVLMVAYFFPSYPMGVLADRFSRKKLLSLGLFVNGLAFVGLSFAPNYGTALACVIVAGLGGSFFHPAATALVARLFPIGTGRALGFLGIGASIGFFFGPLYAGWRATQSGSWRTPVLELGLFGVVAAGLFAWLAVEETATDNATHSNSRPTNGHLFPTTALLVIFLVAAFTASLRDFAGHSMGSLGSLFLQNARGFTVKETGTALSLIFIASAISNPLFGHFSDRARMRWGAAVLLIAAVFIAAFPHVPSKWVGITYLVYGFFFMANYPIIEALLMESVPDSVRGRVFGLFITVGGLLSSLSHWFVGTRVEAFGARASESQTYFNLYLLLGGLVALSVITLPCLNVIRTRERVALESAPCVPDSALK